MIINASHGKLYLRFNSRNKAAFNPFLGKVQSLPEREFDKPNKCWWVPAEYLLEVQERFPYAETSESALKAFKRLERAANASVMVGRDDIEIEVPGGKLRPYQAIGVRYLEAKHGRVLIADEMGLGKR